MSGRRLSQSIPDYLEILRQERQNITEQQLIFGDNALRAYNLNLKIINHVKRFPEDSHLLGSLIITSKIATRYIIEAQERGQQINDAKTLVKRRPRAWLVSRYNKLISVILSIAYREAHEILPALTYGKKADKNLKYHRKVSDGEEKDDEIDEELFS